MSRIYSAVVCLIPSAPAHACKESRRPIGTKAPRNSCVGAANPYHLARYVCPAQILEARPPRRLRTTKSVPCSDCRYNEMDVAIAVFRVPWQAFREAFPRPTSTMPRRRTRLSKRRLVRGRTPRGSPETRDPPTSHTPGEQERQLQVGG